MHVILYTLVYLMFLFVRGSWSHNNDGTILVVDDKVTDFGASKERGRATSIN